MADLRIEEMERFLVPSVGSCSLSSFLQLANFFSFNVDDIVACQINGFLLLVFGIIEYYLASLDLSRLLIFHLASSILSSGITSKYIGTSLTL